MNNVYGITGNEFKNTYSHLLLRNLVRNPPGKKDVHSLVRSKLYMNMMPPRKYTFTAFLLTPNLTFFEEIFFQRKKIEQNLPMKVAKQRKGE